MIRQSVNSPAAKENDTTEPPWMLGAYLVGNNFEALEAASGDAPYILDFDDLDEAAAWVIADVPIEAIHVSDCRESLVEHQKRLQSVRNVPQNALFRPILTYSMNGSLGLFDGGHRIEVAAERGLTHISALVKLDFVPVIQGQSNKIRSGLVPEEKWQETQKSEQSISCFLN